MVIGLKGARNQERLSWRGPAGMYWTGDIWSNALGVRQSPAGNDASRRGHCWDQLPGNY
jgi:hypothetical protein